MRKFFYVFTAAVAAVVVAGFLIPERKAMPCCTPADYNHNTFWYWPWTRGENGHPHTGFVEPGDKIATLGKTGNAVSTPAHVHYGIITPIPYVWRAFSTAGTCNPPEIFNWRLMFWLNPADHLPKE